MMDEPFLSYVNGGEGSRASIVSGMRCERKKNKDFFRVLLVVTLFSSLPQPRALLSLSRNALPSVST